jgi:hypothetical protein
MSNWSVRASKATRAVGEHEAILLDPAVVSLDCVPIFLLPSPGLCSAFLGMKRWNLSAKRLEQDGSEVEAGGSSSRNGLAVEFQGHLFAHTHSLLRLESDEDKIERRNYFITTVGERCDLAMKNALVDREQLVRRKPIFSAINL